MPAPDSPTSLAFNPGSTSGALLLAALSSCVLWGISTMQTYTYFKKFPNDPRGWKMLVSLIWFGTGTETTTHTHENYRILGLASTICLSDLVYNFDIINDGNPAVLEEGRFPRNMLALNVVTTFSSALVQAFYAFRIYKLAPRDQRTIRFIPILLWFLILAFLAVSSTGTIVAGSTNLVTYTTRRQYFGLIVLPCATGFATDLMITLCMSWLLFQARDGVSRGTTMLLDQLLKWTLETGLLTAALGGLMVGFVVWEPSNFIWFGLFVVRSRVFAIALLASLTSRRTLREHEKYSDNTLYIPGPGTAPAPTNHTTSTSMTRVVQGYPGPHSGLDGPRSPRVKMESEEY
uniref:DUF6534 domain-containing protein n=1 Tax=Mycena chlorophos TaxID=658473 RepID=A0ABQ0LYB3_MYCCL|nr:predicted protein [Mycena chlorophos]